MKHRTPFISFSLLLLACATSQAAELNIDNLKIQQQQLQSLLSDIEKSAQQRAQQKQKIQQLRHQLECNLTLIRSYETCGQLYGNNPKEHLECSSTAKRTATNCLNAAPSK